MSNIILLLIIFILPIIFIPTFHFIANTTGFSVVMFADLASWFIVFLSTLCFYLSTANNKTFFNKKSVNLKFNFLKETFLFTAFIGTFIGLSAIWQSYRIESGSSEFTGEMWVYLGLSIGVCLVTDLYGILGYLSTSIIGSILKRKSDLEKKITIKYDSNPYLSLIFLIIPILIFSGGFILAYSNTGDIPFSNYFSNYVYISLFSVLILLTALIVGSNFNVVLKSFLNKFLDIIEINNAIDSLKRLCRIILITCGLIFIASIVLTAFSFGTDNYFNVMSNNLSMISSYIAFSLIFVVILRTFIFRLNLDLIEQNHISIDSDKYFIFKYCLPMYISMHIVSGFAFIIMIFK